MRLRAAAAIGLTLLAVGCARQRPPGPTPPVSPVIRSPAAGQAMTAAGYVATSASFDRLVISAAEMALVRAREPRLRAHARAELADHRGLSAQLSLAGRRVNLLPSSRMRDSDVKRLLVLEAAVGFDAAYKKQMIDTHDLHLTISRDVAQRGASPTLRPVARNAAEVVARHLAQLRAI